MSAMTRPFLIGLVAGSFVFSVTACPLASAESCTRPLYGPALGIEVVPNLGYPVIGDLDGDGDIDLAVPNDSGVAVLLNKGDGSFVTPAFYSASPAVYAYSLTICDLDVDGDPDLAIAYSYSDHVAILINDGDGNFAPPVHYATGDWPVSVAIGDVDGDGDPDLAVANNGSYSVSILSNAGDATFLLHADPVVNVTPQRVILRDLDGDGDADLAVWGGGVAWDMTNYLSVLLNPGDGSFVGSALYPGVGSSPDFADLEGDGDLDIAFTSFGCHRPVGGCIAAVGVMLNDGAGAFSEGRTYAKSEFKGFGTPVVADLDGDGDADLAVAVSSFNLILILINAGNGTFNDSTTFDAGANPSAPLSGDLDGDGDLDLAVTNFPDAVSILLNVCAAPPIPGDLDGDGLVNARDLAGLLGAWGSCGECGDCPADVSGDCAVDAADLAILLDNWSA